MIHVLATIQVNPGCRDDFLSELDGVVDTVRAEQGCIEYGPAVEFDILIPVQARPRGNVVTIIEKWASLDDLTQHLAAPHMVEHRGRVRDLVEWVDLRILKPA